MLHMLKAGFVADIKAVNGGIGIAEEKLVDSSQFGLAAGGVPEN